MALGVLRMKELEDDGKVGLGWFTAKELPLGKSFDETELVVIWDICDGGFCTNVETALFDRTGVEEKLGFRCPEVENELSVLKIEELCRIGCPEGVKLLMIAFGLRTLFEVCTDGNEFEMIEGAFNVGGF